MTDLRIGISGHRVFDDRSVVATMTNSVLDRLLAGTSSVAIVSSLAEGADRLLADLVLARPSSRLEVILPLPVDDYAQDFPASGSIEEFRRLLAAASDVEVVDQLPSDDRDAAYERAGHVMVDRVDVLIALWDGEPSRGRGGTAEIIQYALEHDVMVEVILVERDAAP